VLPMLSLDLGSPNIARPLPGGNPFALSEEMISIACHGAPVHGGHRFRQMTVPNLTPQKSKERTLDALLDHLKELVAKE